jgi:hypothetical protein
MKYDGKELIQISNNIDDILMDVDFHPSGKYAIIVGLEGTILTYDGVQIKEIAKLNKKLRALSWKPNGEYALIVGGDGSSENIWFLYSNGVIKGINFENIQFHDVKWKPDGSYALIAGFDVILKIDDNGRIETLFKDDHVSFQSIGWSSTGDYALITCWTYKGPSILPENFILQFDGTKFSMNWNGTSVGWFDGDVSFNPNGDIALIASGDLGYGKLIWFNCSSKRVDRLINMLKNEDIFGVAWHPSGGYALIVGESSIWKFAEGNISKIYQRIKGHLDAIAWDKGGLNAFITGHYSPAIYVTNWTGISEFMDRGGFVDIAFKPNSNEILALSGNIVYSLNYKTKALKTLAILNTSLLMCLDITLDGLSVLIASYDGKVWIYNSTDGRITSIQSSTTEAFRAAKWHPSGSYALLVGDGGIFKYSKGKEMLSKLSNEQGLDVSFNKNGSFALIATCKGILKYNDKGAIEKIATFDLGLVSSLDIHPYKDYAIMSCALGIYKLDLKSLTYTKLHSGSLWGLGKVKFRPDGAYALVAGAGGSLFKIFDEEEIVPIEITSDIKCHINFNKESYETPFKDIIIKGKKYFIEIQETLIFESSGSRYVFCGWNDKITDNKIILSTIKPLSFHLIWKKQYLVSVFSSFGEVFGNGWYDEGSTATVSISPTLITHMNWTRHVFSGWYEHGRKLNVNSTYSLTVDRPRSIVAGWDTEYKVEVFSEHGATTGSGWYKRGSTATVSISPTLVEKDFFSLYVFEGWKVNKEIVSTSPNFTFTVDKPISLTISWRTDLKIITLLPIVVILTIIATLLWKVRSVSQPLPLSPRLQYEKEIEREINKYREYLDKLEELRNEGRVSVVVYEKLKQEYKKKLDELLNKQCDQ